MEVRCSFALGASSSADNARLSSCWGPFLLQTLELTDLSADLLLAICCATGGECGCYGSLLATCKLFNQLLRPAVASATRGTPSPTDAHRSLAALRPSRFSGLRAVTLWAPSAVAADLEQLQVGS